MASTPSSWEAGLAMAGVLRAQAQEGAFTCPGPGQAWVGTGSVAGSGLPLPGPVLTWQCSGPPLVGWTLHPGPTKHQLGLFQEWAGPSETQLPTAWPWAPSRVGHRRL